VVVDALTEMLVVWVVSEPLELILHLVRQVAGLDYRVDDLLGGEFRVKVGHVQHGFNGWFERRLNLLGKKTIKVCVRTVQLAHSAGHAPVPIYMSCKERISLNFLRTASSKSPGRVSL
jgi:hypothetical protein